MVHKNELWDILENSNGVNDELFLDSLQEELKQVREHGHSSSRDLRLKNRYGKELDFQVTLLSLSSDDKTDRVLLHITDTSIEVEESCNQRRLEQARAVHQTLCKIWPIAAQTLQDFELPEKVSSDGS